MNSARSFPRRFLALTAAALLAAGALGLGGRTEVRADNFECSGRWNSGICVVEPLGTYSVTSPTSVSFTWHFGADATDDATPPDVTLIKRDGAVLLPLIPQNLNRPNGPYTTSDSGLTPGKTYAYQMCSEYGVNDDGSGSLFDSACAAPMQVTLPSSTQKCPTGESGTPPNCTKPSNSGGTPPGAPTNVRLLSAGSGFGSSVADIGWTPGAGANAIEVLCKDTSEPAARCGMAHEQFSGQWTVEPPPSDVEDEAVGTGIVGNEVGALPSFIAISYLRTMHTYVVTVCDTNAGSPNGSTTPSCANPVTFQTPLDTSADPVNLSPICVACGYIP